MENIIVNNWADDLEKSKVDPPEEVKLGEHESAGQAIKELLFIEHQDLLRSAMATRLTSRAVLVGLILFEVSVKPLNRWQHIVIGIVGIVVALSWFIHEVFGRRGVDRIKEIIAQADTEVEATLWVRTFIKLRHERWQEKRIETSQRIEPIIWLAAVILVAMLGFISNPL